MEAWNYICETINIATGLLDGIMEIQKRKGTYVASTRANFERGCVIARLCIQTIRINIAFFSSG
jgi:hypothetical protein